MEITLDEEMLRGLTPLEERDGRWYKREDLLAYSNGVNGKTRTSLWLADRAAAAGATTLVYGGSVHAPALGRVASAAAYRGLASQIVIGSVPEKAVRHPTVRVAAEAGAELVHSAVAYNPVLQARVREIVKASGGTAWAVPYGVSSPEGADAEVIRSFLDSDKDQVVSLLDTGIDTLVMAFGSANAASGVVWGLHRNPDVAAQLKRIVFVGVGPDKRAWFEARMAYIGVDLDALGPELTYLPTYPWFAEYTDRMPETVDDIEMHPLYEGKVVRYLDMTAPEWWTRRDGSTCFWIVGGPLK